jgi:uncharacterized membrane protein
MTDPKPFHGKLLHPHLVFRLFKYAVYALLTYNAFLFFQEDLAASAETFGDTVTWRNVVEAYSATIDTSAWVALLLLFELETAVIPDEKLQGGLKWLLSGVRGICYFFIVYAFYGYCQKYFVITDLLPFSIADVCSLVGSEWNFVADLDDYPPLNATACLTLQGQELLRVAGTELIGTREALNSAFGLAVIDIVNASTWLLVVVMLEAEVWMQLKDVLTDRLMLIGKVVKAVLYSTLFVCAAYWGFEGSFLDFWDAFLWLVAFIFIEMNIFQWHEEVEEAWEQDQAAPHKKMPVS